jgi:LysM repeat protein
MISTKVTAGRSDSRVKLVTSVKIEKGDSLWSIAEEYFTDDYADINTYIKEIKRSNGLTSDIIHEDCYIIVPYYTD